MYNSIGLPTPRGSGTSGYVQRNLGFLHPAKNDVNAAPAPQLQKDFKSVLSNLKKSDEILEHERKRKIECKVFELCEKLRDEGQDEETIKRVAAHKRRHLSRLVPDVKASKELARLDTHEVADLKLKQLQRFGGALGISTEHNVGKAFDRELQEEEKKIRKLKSEAVEAERQQAEIEGRQRRRDRDDISRRRSSKRSRSRSRSHKRRSSRRRSPSPSPSTSKSSRSRRRSRMRSPSLTRSRSLSRS
eukprot:Lankesteria_metandrocarpae@DN1981_c0_g1_i2.p1